MNAANDTKVTKAIYAAIKARRAYLETLHMTRRDGYALEQQSKALEACGFALAKLAIRMG